QLIDRSLTVAVTIAGALGFSRRTQRAQQCYTRQDTKPGGDHLAAASRCRHPCSLRDSLLLEQEVMPAHRIDGAEPCALHHSATLARSAACSSYAVFDRRPIVSPLLSTSRA